MRSLLSILVIGVTVTMILCLVGVSHGVIEDTQRRARGVGADILIRPKNASLLSSGLSMPQEMVAYFQKQPHVAVAAGVYNVQVDSVFLGASGIDMDELNRLTGGFKFVDGGPFTGPNDLIVDEYTAAQKRYKVGQTVKVLNLEWRVAGIMENGKLSHMMMPIVTLQDKMSGNGKISIVYLKLDNPANTKDVIAALSQITALEGYPIYPMEEYAALWSVDSIPLLKGFTIVIVGIAVVIGFTVVCLSMYMAVLQRTREIGILKSLGGSKVFILRTILTEAVFLGLGGTILGIAMSYGAYWVIRTLQPGSLTMIIVYSWWPKAGAITLAGAVLGALYPGLTAAAHDPIEALAYE